VLGLRRLSWSYWGHRRDRITRKLLLLCALLAGSVALPVKDVAACALDQRPSMSADGRLVVVNSHAPTNPQAFATWSYFVLPGAFPARRALLLTEDRREVARTLTAEAMRQRCA
jgi:hypothetical protein